MTSDKLFSVADRLAGFAARGEPLEPAMAALVASIVHHAAEMTANMEACVVAPTVCAELAEIMHDAA